jgi:bifunctional UDP-N-acetylglucosamine pyrophosphorylase/glucosamine-1-phosphate N-acetyltransferase
MQPTVVILAAGQGTRMRSALPKVLHEVAGRPLVEHVVRAAQLLEPARIIIVTGHGAEQVEARLRGYPVSFVRQEEQLGTGHAFLQTQPLLAGFKGPVMLLNGDAPLLTAPPLKTLLARRQETGAGMVLLTCEVTEPRGLGRVFRDADGSVVRIVEEKEATTEERAIREVNPGFYLFEAGIFELVRELGNDNDAGEYYITDLVNLYHKRGRTVQAVLEPGELALQVGVNDREQLAYAERLLRDRIRRDWLLAGVTMIAPEQTFIDDTVRLAEDVTLYPGVWLKGKTVVERGATVGPYVVLEDCTIEPGAKVAPFSVLRGENIGRWEVGGGL